MAFTLVSRRGLLTLPYRIGRPLKFLKMITYFHDEMKGTVQYDGSSSEPFPIRSGVKQGCFLALTLFGTFYMLLCYTLYQTKDGVYIHARGDGSLFNLARLHVKTNVSAPGDAVRR